MLIQYSNINALDDAAKARLKAALSGLLQTSEAANGYVMFEGKYYSTAAVSLLSGGRPQFLSEG